MSRSEFERLYAIPNGLQTDRVVSGNRYCNMETEHAYRAWTAGRQSAGANETTLHVLPHHAIRKHEGVTIFGDPAQVLKIMAAIESAGATGQEPVASMDDLSMLIRQLVHALRKASPDNALAERATDYLKRKGLQGSPLRAAPIGDNGAACDHIYISGQCSKCGCVHNGE
jgi:hypothetical protein